MKASYPGQSTTAIYALEALKEHCPQWETAGILASLCICIGGLFLKGGSFPGMSIPICVKHL